MASFIVVYRKHGQLNCETQYLGTFPDFDTAYEYLCTLPAIGINTTGDNNGVKFIQELVAPDSVRAKTLTAAIRNERIAQKYCGEEINVYTLAGTITGEGNNCARVILKNGLGSYAFAWPVVQSKMESDKLLYAC